MTATSDRLYEALSSTTAGDDGTLNSLAVAVTQSLDYVNSLAEDSGATPGWSTLLDLNITRDEFLPYIGQFVGVPVPLTVTPAVQRTLIQDAAGRNRGTPNALITAVQTTLIGTKEVILIERYTGSAYKIHVTTFAAETPDAAVTEAALKAATPGGIIYTYVNLPGESYAELDADFTTYADMTATGGTYDDLRKRVP